MMRRWMVVASAVVLGCTFLPGIASATTSGATSTSTSTITAYSLAAPRSTAASGIVARAVVPAGSPCPRLDVEDASGTARSVLMRERPRPERTSPAFDSLTVCSVHMPSGATHASIEGQPIPAAMPTTVDRLAMLGDSGCRISSWEVQDCADTSAWPLARISSAIAADRPDAILFNGDYFYREAACPSTDQALCGASPPPVEGMPFRDSDYGWLADVFVPMRPMLSAAPFITTRGNHEECYRGGNGYFYFMDPRDGTSSTCSPVVVDGTLTAAPTVPTATYAIDLSVSPGRTLRLAIVDSAGGDDRVVGPFAAVQRPAYLRAEQLTAPRAGRESWLVTHRPLYGFVTTTFATPGEPFNPWRSADQAAAAWDLLDNYGLVFSSHQHMAQAVNLPGMPPQLILGNAGTKLDPTIGYPLPTTGAPAGAGRTYPAPSSAWVEVRFGYAIAEPGSDSWQFSQRDPSGAEFARCGLRDRDLYCRSAS